MADQRIPILLQTPAAKRFVSVEPMLGPVDLEAVPMPNAYLRMVGVRGCLQPKAERDTEPDDYRYFQRKAMKLDWVICGGESGPGARPMNIDWPRSLRDQCQAAGVPFFFKQWGEWGPHPIAKPHPTEQFIKTGEGHFVNIARVGKKAAGCLLDGKEWKEFPEVKG
jgi:protein gp37